MCKRQWFVEAYYEDGTQKLGNLDGQGMHKAKHFSNTRWYYRLLSGHGRMHWPAVAYWIVRDEAGHAHVRIINKWFISKAATK